MQKLENNGVEFPDDVVDYIALRITSNTRNGRKMIAILAQVSLNNKKITIDYKRDDR